MKRKLREKIYKVDEMQQRSIWKNEMEDDNGIVPNHRHKQILHGLHIRNQHQVLYLKIFLAFVHATLKHKSFLQVFWT